MSDRNQGRKPSQMANKAKKGTKNQSQRIERDMDRMDDDTRRDMDRAGAGMRNDAEQAAGAMRGKPKAKDKRLQHH